MSHGRKLYESLGLHKRMPYPDEDNLIAALSEFYSPESVDFFALAREHTYDAFTQAGFQQLVVEKLPGFELSEFERTFQTSIDEKLLRPYHEETDEPLFCYVSHEELMGFFIRSDSQEPAFVEMRKYSGYITRNVTSIGGLNEIPYTLRRFRVFAGPKNTQKYELKLDLEDPRAVLAIDDILDMLKHQKRYALAKCICRESVGDCSEPEGHCMYFDEIATYNIEIGQAEEITYEEAVEYIKLSRKKGLVNYGANVQNTSYLLCNCCKDCCQLLQLVQAGLGGVLSPSRFVAEIDQEKCIGCGMCKDRCPAKTIHGEKGVFTVGDNCIGCGICTEACRYGAAILKLREDAADIIPRFKNYRDWDVEVKKLSREIHETTF